MHFFYLDESGDTGANLQDQQQPIFVLAGLSVADKKWNNTKECLDEIINQYFNDSIPAGFEVHSHALLSPRGEGFFHNHPIEQRLELVRELLNLIEELGHQVHYFAIEKSLLAASDCEYETVFNSKHPYLLSFDYLITYMNWHVKNNLGQSARGMIVLDEKEEHNESIEQIIQNRRFEVPNTQKVKWIVEFSHPIDSRKNPMIQLSDLVALCIRRFLEYERGYKTAPEQVTRFYAECFNLIDKRVKSKNIIDRNGRNLDHLNEHLSRSQCKPRTQWRRQYGIQRN
ncbi:DUF3800 domain-containing protein [uncultured Tolumonas sp.]|uniref:DUF3800 domain-containing protein n=1 Tax=uncultured Tolumonas sp. TaxID=263765 RepID=UPI002A0A96BF|nr:DUF3800 domain-containing protein [uncultured Tolumonas sp.]